MFRYKFRLPTKKYKWIFCEEMSWQYPNMVINFPFARMPFFEISFATATVCKSIRKSFKWGIKLSRRKRMICHAVFHLPNFRLGKACHWKSTSKRQSRGWEKKLARTRSLLFASLPSGYPIQSKQHQNVHCLLGFWSTNLLTRGGAKVDELCTSSWSCRELFLKTKTHTW